MWPFDFYNPMIPLFRGAKAVAANVPQPGEKGTYTLDMFQVDFPQFFSATKEPETTITPMLPESLLQGFIEQAKFKYIPCYS